MRILMLKLEGPMQSWGERSQWDSRDTALMPTKSGIVGLIACAMGIPRGDRRIPEMNERIKIGIREDRPGMLGSDFQTITAKKMMLADRSNEDKTILSPRQYLYDAAFTVALASDDSLLDAIAHALRHPVWPLFLGRKSCVPTNPLIPEDTDAYASIQDALEHFFFAEYRNQTQNKSAKESCNLRVEMESSDGQFTRPDSITGIDRLFGARNVQYYTVIKEADDVSLKTDA